MNNQANQKSYFKNPITIGKEIGIAVFVFVLLIIAIGVLIMYLYKRKKAGNRGEDQNIGKKKSKTFVPDFTGIQYTKRYITHLIITYFLFH